MEIQASGETASRSPFSRPPQPRPSTIGGADPVHREPRASGNGATRAQVSPVAARSTGDAERAALEAQRRSGAQWFYWVAALSLINSVLALTGQDWRFILGLGVTQLIQELAAESAHGGTTSGLVSLVVIAGIALLGNRAIAGHGWAFVAGIVVYALDGLIFLLVQDWLGVGFHAFVVAMVVRGYLAARQLAA